MTKFNLMIITEFTKYVQIEADSQEDAIELAWSQEVEDGDPLHNADIDTRVVYDGEEENA